MVVCTCTSLYKTNIPKYIMYHVLGMIVCPFQFSENQRFLVLCINNLFDKVDIKFERLTLHLPVMVQSI